MHDKCMHKCNTTNDEGAPVQRIPTKAMPKVEYMTASKAASYILSKEKLVSHVVAGACRMLRSTMAVTAQHLVLVGRLVLVGQMFWATCSRAP